MLLVYGICAAIGGTLLVCQFILTLIGGGDFDGGDVDFGDLPDAGAAHASNWFLSAVSYQTLVAALTFFGLAGLASLSAEIPALGAFAIAITAGFGALYGMHTMMQSLSRLRADGTTRVEKAVGVAGVVYLRIPAKRSGAGKVHIVLQGRTLELQAMTDGDTLPTGATIVVTEILGPDLVAVESTESAKELSHA